MADSRNFTDGAVEAILARWDSETLFNARKQVKFVLSDPGFDAIRSLIEEGATNAQDRLIHGPTRDQADYARALGLISGMKMILEVPDKIIDAADAREEKLKKRVEESPAEEKA